MFVEDLHLFDENVCVISNLMFTIVIKYVLILQSIMHKLQRGNVFYKLWSFIFKIFILPYFYMKLIMIKKNTELVFKTRLIFTMKNVTKLFY